MSVGVFLLIAFGIVVLYIMGAVLETPLKWLFRLLVNAAVGGLALGGLNLAGALVNFSLAVNPASALLVGFLGIPGIVLLLSLRLVIV